MDQGDQKPRGGTLRMLGQRLIRRRWGSVASMASAAAEQPPEPREAAHVAPANEDAEIEAWVNALEGMGDKPQRRRSGGLF
jgi:hypothetical protein